MFFLEARADCPDCLCKNPVRLSLALGETLFGYKGSSYIASENVGILRIGFQILLPTCHGAHFQFAVAVDPGKYQIPKLCPIPVSLGAMAASRVSTALCKLPLKSL